MRISLSRESFNCFSSSPGDVGRPDLSFTSGQYVAPRRQSSVGIRDSDRRWGRGRSLSTFCIPAPSVSPLLIDRLHGNRMSDRLVELVETALAACGSAARGERRLRESAKASTPRGVCKDGNHKGQKTCGQKNSFVEKRKLKHQG